MAYFNQEMKKVLVKRLKSNFPDWKFSVSVHNHTSVCVKIKSAPLNLVKNYNEVLEKENGFNRGMIRLNQYYLERVFSGEYLEQMRKLMSDINLVGDKNANYDNSDSRSDYCDVGYFISLYLGYDDEKPFEYLKKS